ncbi:epsin-1-like [Branchiostoma floridae]|uniref:Epsin-1-like n=1 Tax=Branchiostoma floridae TaxID=7739 RepID=A0A9J7M8P0_BRAFL|nr:epsin-1-like [Branchiostoma floridae]
MPVRRSLKNVVHNYTEPQVKVREATSNDPWGPSSSLMTEIADLTYHVVAFSEIMSMIWKRLNDHGKNWRHVYKSLVLLDYIIKTGSERVAQQCKENIFAIQTLKDFQFIDRDGKDQGVNVREKSKQLVALLKDDDRLKQERQRALKAKERFAQANTGIGSSSPQLFSESQEGKGASSSPYRADDTNFGDVGPASEATAGTPPGISSDIEQARPQTHGEEELQLQLALAMSKEEADQVSKEMAQVKSQPGAAQGPPGPPAPAPAAAPQPPAEDDDIQLRYVLAMSKGEAEKEERMRRGDDVRLQMALEESQKENSKEELNQSSLLDLADTTPPGHAADPWGGPAPANNSAPQPIRQTDPWGGGATISAPASATNMAAVAQADPWGSSSPPAQPKSAPPPIQQADPWGGGSTSQPSSQSQSPWGSPAISSSAPVSSTSFDAFGNSSQTASNDLDGFDLLGSRSTGGSGDLLGGGVSLQNNVGPFNMMGLDQGLPMQPGGKQKTPETFLGENSSLVNLDNLISQPAAPPPVLPPPAQPAVTNPFLGIAPPSQPLSQPPPAAKPVSNPFQAQMVRPPTINQMRSPPGPPVQPGLVGLGGADGLPQPLLPMGTTAQPAQPTNPFLHDGAGPGFTHAAGRQAEDAGDLPWRELVPGEPGQPDQPARRPATRATAAGATSRHEPLPWDRATLSTALATASGSQAGQQPIPGSDGQTAHYKPDALAARTARAAGTGRTGRCGRPPTTAPPHGNHSTAGAANQPLLMKLCCSAPVSSTSFDAFGNSSQTASNDLDGFDLLGSRSTGGSGDLLGGGVSSQNNVDAFNMMGLDQGLPMQPGGKQKTPETFLGENSSLVNLDNLISQPAAPPPVLPPPAQPAVTNPFLGIAPPSQPLSQPPPASKPVSNPFQAQMVRPPTINQMRSPPGPPVQPGLVGLGGADGLPQPLLPMGTTAQPAQPTNPFL